MSSLDGAVATKHEDWTIAENAKPTFQLIFRPLRMGDYGKSSNLHHPQTQVRSFARLILLRSLAKMLWGISLPLSQHAVAFSMNSSATVSLNVLKD